jgi:predicted O-methyltransferase YrrM
VQQKSIEEGLPAIAVSPAQGKLLQLLARSINAKRILEVGTLGGYSTIWLARAVPSNGEVVTLELERKHAEVAERNIALAGHADKVKVIVGPAADTLETLQPEPPYDFIFIDADKPSNVIYYRHAKRLVRPGGVIMVDNVVRKGQVANLSYTDPKIEGVRDLLHLMKEDDEVEATTIATVGEKGYDGFIYAIKS